MTLETAIKTAIEYESRVRDVYSKNVEHISDSVGKRIFQVLADEEKQHVEYLQGKLEEWKKSGKVTVGNLTTAIPSREAIAKGISALKIRTSGRDRFGEVRLLKKALDMEIAATNFYKKMVDELEPEGRHLFSPFLDIEEGHEAIVQAQIDLVSGTGFWFDFSEINLEAG